MICLGREELLFSHVNLSLDLYHVFLNMVQCLSHAGDSGGRLEPYDSVVTMVGGDAWETPSAFSRPKPPKMPTVCNIRQLGACFVFVLADLLNAMAIPLSPLCRSASES